MNEKYIAGVGGGLILFSFGIIVLFFVFQGVEDKVAIQNGTPGFSQLNAIKDEAKNQLQNKTVIEEFKKIVGNVTDKMHESIREGINKTGLENPK